MYVVELANSGAERSVLLLHTGSATPLSVTQASNWYHGK